MIQTPLTTGVEKSTVRIASEFAKSGHGTIDDPWIDGIQEAYDDAISEERAPVIKLGEGIYKATHAIVFDSAVTDRSSTTFSLFGEGGNRSIITTDNNASFNLFELSETEQGAMGYLSDFKTTYNGTEVVIKNYNLMELYLRGSEIRADRGHKGLLVFNPTIRDQGWNQIEECFFLGGTNNDVEAQIQFKKPGAFKTVEILISECYITGGYPRGKLIEVNDDALGRWSITGCRWSYFALLMDIKGKIGSGGFGGIHYIEPGSTSSTAITNPTIVRFSNLTAALDSNIRISGIQLGPNPTQNFDYGVWIGNNWDRIQVIGNNFHPVDIQEVYVKQGANEHGRVEQNLGANPFGVKATPFDNTNDLVHINGGAAGPTSASTDYVVAMTGCRIISTGGTAVSITIKDKAGTTISTPGATCDEWLEPEWKINFGAFSAAPTVVVAFR